MEETVARAVAMVSKEHSAVSWRNDEQARLHTAFSAGLESQDVPRKSPQGTVCPKDMTYVDGLVPVSTSNARRDTYAASSDVSGIEVSGNGRRPRGLEQLEVNTESEGECLSLSDSGSSDLGEEAGNGFYGMDIATMSCGTSKPLGEDGRCEDMTDSDEG